MSVLTNHVALVSESTKIKLSDLTTVAAALQKQVTRDFGPAWSINATVSAYDKLESVPVDYWPVIIQDDIKEPGAAGYHTDKNGQPYALVQYESDWPLTVSHETLEMLADPFGNRIMSGAPPQQAPANIKKLKQVVYLVEVCDPCEADQYAYKVNGIAMSDFITHFYYDPAKVRGHQYSFTGSITAPHQVIEGGYISFGNPVDNHWYQIMVQNGKVHLEDLGVIQTNGKTLKETLDRLTRERVGTRGRVHASEAKTELTSDNSEAQSARANALREVMHKSR